MRRVILAGLLLTACSANGDPQAEYRFDNGLWFDGQEFSPRTAYVNDGKLKFSDTAAPADNIVNLEGGYVVPPYCEGHNHNLGGSVEGVEETVQRYLQDGIFYAVMPGSFELYRNQISDRLNTASSVDVSFANNGLTGSGGHPRGLRESLMDRFGLYPEFTKETLPDKGYFEADTVEEVRAKWRLIAAEETDFIKVMLYFSEEYEKRKDDPQYYGRRGLNPALLPEIVTLAHEAGLRVAVHVESDADMATALRAGADIITHLPSYDNPLKISDETITLARETQAALVTTLSIARRRFEQRAPEVYAAAREAQKRNLQRLHAAGATLVLGSDNVQDTSRNEADYIADLDALDNLTLLKMWTENCAQMAFPDRKIGKLNDGYEASFLVLKGDPLDDFKNTSNILIRVKDGLLLETAKTAP